MKFNKCPACYSKTRKAVKKFRGVWLCEDHIKKAKRLKIKGFFAEKLAASLPVQEKLYDGKGALTIYREFYIKFK